MITTLLNPLPANIGNEPEVVPVVTLTFAPPSNVTVPVVPSNWAPAALLSQNPDKLILKLLGSTIAVPEIVRLPESVILPFKVLVPVFVKVTEPNDEALIDWSIPLKVTNCPFV